MISGDDAEGLFAGGVADMDCKALPAVLEALQLRLNYGVFGYEAVPDNLMPALTTWLSTRHSWHVDSTHILRAPNILNSLAIAASLHTAQGDGIIVQPPVFFELNRGLSNADPNPAPSCDVRDRRRENTFVSTASVIL